MNRLALLIFTTVTFIGTIYFNYLFSSGAGGRETVGGISQKYDTLITPAGYAFSIWGLIYLMLLSFLIFQWVTYFRKTYQKSIDPTGIWLGIANIMNALWIYTWTSEQLGLSVIVMLVLFLSLLILMFKLRLEIWDAPLDTIAFVWWPICLYLGWIIIALVANISAWLISLNAFPGFQVEWTIFILLIATIIYLFITWSRNLREAALVGVWAFVAIAHKQIDNESLIAYVAIGLSVVLVISSGIHAFKNKKTLPHTKI